MRRPGITLLEVLSAIFITGIGLLSLLTLFPLGALKMAEAVRDDRCALAGGNGIATANAVDMRGDFDVQAAMLNLPDPVLNPITPFQLWPQSPTPDGPGYPVLVDPIGTYAYTGIANWQSWVASIMPTAAAPLQGVPRVRGQWLRPLNPLGPLVAADYLRWCSITDDLNFNSDGAFLGQAQDPPVYAGGLPNVQRNLRYSFAWMMRMPRAAAPNVVDVSVLVFSGRSLDLVGFDTQEKAYTAVFNAQANTITLVPDPTTGTASLRRGQWILDSSLGTNVATNTLSVRGFFYRIVSVSDPDAAGNVTVEVQTPLRGWTTVDPAFPVSTNPLGQTGTVVIFDNLVEVFDDGTF